MAVGEICLLVFFPHTKLSHLLLLSASLFELPGLPRGCFSTSRSINWFFSIPTLLVPQSPLRLDRWPASHSAVEKILLSFVILGWSMVYLCEKNPASYLLEPMSEEWQWAFVNGNLALGGLNDAFRHLRKMMNMLLRVLLYCCL